MTGFYKRAVQVRNGAVIAAAALFVVMQVAVQVEVRQSGAVTFAEGYAIGVEMGQTYWPLIKLAAVVAAATAIYTWIHGAVRKGEVR